MEVVEKVRRTEAELQLALTSSLVCSLPRELIGICSAYVLDPLLLFEKTLLLFAWRKVTIPDLYAQLCQTGDTLWKRYQEELSSLVGRHYPTKTKRAKFCHAMSLYQRLLPLQPCHRLRCFYSAEQFPTDETFCCCGHPVRPTQEIIEAKALSLDIL